MNEKEYISKSKKLDRIVKTLKELGYEVVEQDETSITFAVDGGGWLHIEYGYPREDNPIGIWVSE